MSSDSTASVAAGEFRSGDGSPIGLIAGHGKAPFLVAEGIKRAGHRLVVAGFKDHASERLRALADDFEWVGIARLGSWIRCMKKYGVHQAIMIGGAKKRGMYSPLRVFRYLPDLRSAWLWYIKIRKDKRDNALLLAVADELAGEGIELVSSVKYCQEQLATEGVMTAADLPSSVQRDVEFGWGIARASADLDIGQSMAVKERDIIAVEAIEGTDAMIRRAGRLCRSGGWTMIKVARPKQDMRFDVPAIGPQTIRNLYTARCRCLVVEAGKTIIVDKPHTLELANKLGVAIVGKLPTASDSTVQA